MLPRYTGNATQRLSIHDKEYILPPRTSVTLNFAALHTHPGYWGPDPLTFRPGRWTLPAGKQTDDTTLFQPFGGSFVPWNWGPRVCPGKKFSQVLFVLVIFSLFANGTRVELVRGRGETSEEAKKRVLQRINGARVEVTLKMVDAEKIGLRWVRKS